MVSLDSLNSSQREAAESLLGRIKVVAGAGTGKTRVLTMRYAHLVEDIGINAGNILCITFTNKAAQEMRRRIERMVRVGNASDLVCTIHGLCVKFLRQEIFRLGYPKTFAIIDEEDRKAYAKRVMEKLGLERTKSTVRRFLNGIEAEKSREREHYVRMLCPGGAPLSTDAFGLYLGEQLKTFALDYDDLIYFTLYILKTYDDARRKWQERMNFVMVDEVQDCNFNDWEIIEIMSSSCGNLFVVGDPDQSIYEWRGACPKIFVNLAADHQVILDENYRSTPNILSVANSIISHNCNRIEKELYTHNNAVDDGQTIYYHASDADDEARWVVSEKIKPAIDAGVSPHDFAILYRASHMSRRFEQELIKSGVPYTMWGGVRFFERMEIKDVIAYLKLIANPDDDYSFERVVNVPSRKFGFKRREVLRQLAETEGRSLMSTLVAHIGKKPFEGEPLRHFVDLILGCHRRHTEVGLDDLVEYVLQHSGLKENLRKDEDEERLENVNELVSSIKTFLVEKHGIEESQLVDYLQDIALYTNADYRRDCDTVKLMTIHQAKGLEFSQVFVVGLNEGDFPNHRSMLERKQAALEEERRLMYVAVTRARQRLYLSESEGYSYTSGDKSPSRFLCEIKDDLYKIEGDFDPLLFEQTRQVVKELDIELYGSEESDRYVAGTRVSHSAFGDGEILENFPRRAVCKVKFAGVTLTITYDKLTVLE